MLRAFVAINVPPLPALLAALNELRQMGRAVRPVDPENLHLTLRFLGALEHGQLEPITAILQRTAQDWPAFDLAITGAGVFPDANRPTLVWAGLGDAVCVAAIAQQVERINHHLTEELDLSQDVRTWTAHLTLARIKARPPAALHDFLQQRRDLHLGTMHVRSIDLMLSDLTPTGPNYTIAASCPLRS
ncbi:MAG: RNA 2',3'-cyclic phosphodiesterase [Phycisphaeraceae bacterium]